MEPCTSSTPHITGILLLGGSGTRFASHTPKQFHAIGGRPLFMYALLQFLEIKDFFSVILVVHRDWINFVTQEIQALPKKQIIQVIPAGRTRQESSFLALKACPPKTEYVVIHDGVRPFVSKEILQRNISQVLECLAVDTCIASADTIVKQTEGHWIHSIPKRENFLRGQTPQSFFFPLILQAHQQALSEGILNSSDDCSLVTRLDIPVKIVAGSETNIKITTEIDLFLAERLLYRALEPPYFTQKHSLSGKLFAVTGATGGIGQALCKQLRAAGAHPIEISTSAPLFRADLTHAEETEKVFSAIHDQYGPLDGLINSIGSLLVKDFSSLSVEEIEKMIACNFTSVLYACRYARLKKGAHIVTLSSSSYSRGRKGFLIYSSLKAALVNFTQGLAEERPDLRIHVVVPQRTDTPLRAKNFPLEAKDSLLSPQAVAETIIRVLRDDSLTGSIIEVRKKHLFNEATSDELSPTTSEGIPLLRE